MWKLGLRPRNYQKRNTWMGFSLQCMIFSTQLEGPSQLVGLFIWNYCNEVTIFSSASQVKQRVYARCHYLTIDVYCMCQW